MYTDYADFISDALKFSFKTNKSRVNILNKFVSIYTLTLPKNKNLKELNSYKIDIHKQGELLDATELSENELLLLKFEITFRVGRLKIANSKKFLNWVFYNDNLLNDYKNKKFDSFHDTTLKRQCAISASLLCDKDIELEYVKKMLLYNKKEYDENYDLVNRSHTLIYYGDVFDENILSFKDSGGNWIKAKKKRIERLSHVASEYSEGDKSACFRLFDLATIYTFLQNRGVENLNMEDISIIENCNVNNIKNMPQDRTKLMIDIKSHIIELINNEQNKNYKSVNKNGE